MRDNNLNSKNLKGFPLKLFKIILTWLSKLAKANTTETLLLQKVLSKIASVYNTRGSRQAIIYSKHLRSSLISYLCNLGSGDNKYYLPKILRSFLPSLQDGSINYPIIRLILSVTYSTRFIRLKEDPSFESIEKEPNSVGTLQSLQSYVRPFLVESLGVNPKHIGRRPKRLRFRFFHMTSKSGPTGLHALWSSFWDICHLPDQLLHDISIVGGDRLGDLMNRFRSLYHQIPQFFEFYAPFKGKEVRRIVAIRDKEGKTREVAILDYWSQSGLRPLHNYLYRFLSRINQDCTHNQAKWLGKLVPTEGSSFHSIDLTTATDRFPIAIEKLILSIWFGEEYAKAWENIMVSLPFDYLGRKIFYKTGNPMGAYSSWATFAIAHHFFIFVACKQANKRWNRCPYCLLGDDIVIADDEVAERYKDLLLEWDIPYNASKTHVSKRLYEFAKQFYFDGKNISPFPLAALFELRKDTFSSIATIVRELSFKDWNSDLWASIKDYLCLIRGWNASKVKRFLPKLKLGIGLMLYLQGLSDLGITLSEYVAEKTNKPVSWTKSTTKLFTQWVAGEVVTSLFIESRDRITGNNPEPLGSLATKMVMAITSLRDGGADCFDLIEAVPFLQIYGRAEETFLRLLKPTIGVRLMESGPKMKAALDVVDIPISDKDFYVRSREVLVIKSLKSSKKIVEILEKLMKKNNNFHRNPILAREFIKEFI